jgi:transmembrane sensor
LDSASEVRVRYSKQTRDLWLERGQARFDVARDPDRPFMVTAGNQKVLATGTVFNVDKQGQQVLVTLIEGHVIVIDQRAESPSWLASSEGSAHRIELRPGQQLAASASDLPKIANVDLARVTAWQAGRLVCDDDTLASVVDRLSRYTRRPILIEDERAAQLRISGVFNTADIDGFIQTISGYLPVHVESGENGALLIHSND